MIGMFSTLAEFEIDLKAERAAAAREAAAARGRHTGRPRTLTHPISPRPRAESPGHDRRRDRQSPRMLPCHGVPIPRRRAGHATQVTWVGQSRVSQDHLRPGAGVGG